MDRTMKKSPAPVALRDEELDVVAGGTLYPFPFPLDLQKITTQIATNVNVAGPQTAVVMGAAGVSLAQGQSLSNSSSQSA